MSCVTASHVRAVIEPSKSVVTPVGISTSGEWSLGEAAQAALAAGLGALPERLDPSGPSISPRHALDSVLSYRGRGR